MKKVVINSCYGGFGLSHEAMMRFAEIKEIVVYPEQSRWHYTYWLLPEGERVQSIKSDVFSAMPIKERQAYNALCEEQTICDRDIPRDDPVLVQVVEELGEKANDKFARLNVVEIPDDVEWNIAEYDGMEHVAEVHRTWS